MRFKKIVLFSIIPTLVVVILLAVGFVAGHYMVTNPFNEQIDEWSRAYTLGGFLNEEQKKTLVQVYHDQDKALQEIDRFSWSVPNVPTPFVGNAPMPGRHGNAYVNSMQFRSKMEIPLPKPKDTFRIFLTGGSTAYSSGAPSEERTIAGYLLKYLSENLTPDTKLNYEVFTMANPSWSTTHERIVIENKLSELEPDLIISLSGNNDVHWGLLGRNVLWFRSLADDFFLNLIKEIYANAGQPEIPEVTRIENKRIAPTLVAQRLLKNVKLTSFALSLEGIDFIFFLQPNLPVTAKKLTDREKNASEPHSQGYFQDCYDLIDEILRNLDIDNFVYFNLTRIFDDLDNQQDIFTDLYHFGDRGNEIIARNIFLKIKELEFSIK